MVDGAPVPGYHLRRLGVQAAEQERKPVARLPAIVYKLPRQELRAHAFTGAWASFSEMMLA
jgi:hypothetical protein